jgi:uncharacterized Ntn-hydrolase superfamily protein
LDRLAAGLDAEAALQAVLAGASFPQFRQLTIIDAKGNTAFHSGGRSLGVHHAAQGKDAVSAGNLLANDGVPAAVIAAFEASDPMEELGRRVIMAMQAGLAAGGEAGPIKSAGLVVVDQEAWPIADLRVDWSDAPLTKLAVLWAVWQPQMHDYVTRALDPSAAPSYGVPGDTPLA